MSEHDPQHDHALLRQSALLQRAGHTLQMGSWEVVLPDQVIWSDQVCDLHRVPHGTRVSVEHALAVFAPASRAIMTAAFEDCVRDGAPFDLELEQHYGDERVWVRVTGQAERDQAGVVRRIHGAAQDITDKKLAEQALARSEQRFRALADSMPHLVWTADAGGRINFVNRAATAITGLTLEQARGEGWLRILHPDDVAPTVAAWSEALRLRTVFTADYRVLVADGQHYRWCRASAMPALDEHGAIVWYGTTTDIDDAKGANAALEQAARRHLATLESISDAFFTLDRGCRFTWLNREAERLLGRDREGLIGVAVADAFAPAEFGNLFAPALHALGGGGTVTFEEWSAPLQRWIEVRAYPSEEGATVYFRDVSRRRDAQEKLRLKRRALEACANPVAIIDAAPPYTVIYMNSACTRVTGHSADTIGRDGLALLCGEDSAQGALVELRAAACEQRPGRGVVRIVRPDGGAVLLDTYLSPLPDEDGRISHFVVAMYDVTAARRYQAELEYKSNYDTLTGLANRNLLDDRAARAIRVAAESGRQLWVAYVNLDRFKAINDALGHAAGDQVLRAVAERLQAALRPADTAARIASDEFVVLLAAPQDTAQAAAQVRAIRAAIAQPLRAGEHDVFPTCSIGVAAWPSDSAELDTLIGQASLARYRATQHGAGVRFYTAAMNEDAIDRLRLENDLRHALVRGELLLEYQPQVGAHDGRILGAEALVRWRHPQLGMVPPGRFIPIAEEAGMIGEIGAWVMHTACAQARAWQDAGLKPVRIAVNLSARQFYQPGMVRAVAATLAATGLAAEWLELELTEGLAIENVAHAVETMHALKRIGVKLSIDDFGTGYSSLSHLRHFPVDVLKVDQSFVRNILTEPGEATIARTIIALGHSLGLQVIAEGVENEQQLAFLRRHGCDLIQGYHFSRPVPAQEFEALLRGGGFGGS